MEAGNRILGPLPSAYAWAMPEHQNTQTLYREGGSLEYSRAGADREKAGEGRGGDGGHGRDHVAFFGARIPGMFAKAAPIVAGQVYLLWPRARNLPKLDGSVRSGHKVDFRVMSTKVIYPTSPL
jgi:hypothetical protein